MTRTNPLANCRCGHFRCRHLPKSRSPPSRSRPDQPDCPRRITRPGARLRVAQPLRPMRFDLHHGPRSTLVGTVPPQHMYGLESTVLMALRGGLVLHAGRPFYPADVAATLAGIPGDRVLVTTPVHLRALLSDGIELPQLRLIVCATASLSPETAAQAEARYRAPLHEVYGFTEAGMVATRRTVQGPSWHCLRDVRLRRDGDVVRVAGGHVENEVPFTDVIESDGDDVFLLHGRNADQVNIAGKRTSLGYLNHQLNSIEGVRDGVFFMPDESGDGVTRLTAFVVAPDITRDVLLEALRARVDAVFLPRPLYFVDSLPRNATGKLPREALVRYAQIWSGRARRERTPLDTGLAGTARTLQRRRPEISGLAGAGPWPAGRPGAALSGLPLFPAVFGQGTCRVPAVSGPGTRSSAAPFGSFPPLLQLCDGRPRSHVPAAQPLRTIRRAGAWQEHSRRGVGAWRALLSAGRAFRQFRGTACFRRRAQHERHHDHVRARQPEHECARQGDQSRPGPVGDRHGFARFDDQGAGEA